MLDIRGLGIAVAGEFWCFPVVGCLLPCGYMAVVDTRRGCHTLKQELVLDHISQREMCVLLKSTGHALCYGSDICMQLHWISIAFFQYEHH